nr:MAG TPA: hypothetical protein [Caudoviricetes sp.]
MLSKRLFILYIYLLPSSSAYVIILSKNIIHEAIMKIKQRGEIKLKTPLQTHMENKSEEEEQTNINSVKEYTVKIKVDTTELDCAIKKLKRLNKIVTKNKLPRVTISTHGNLDEKKIIELLGKYQWK